MRSGSPSGSGSSPIDDRTAKARIRDTAIECFAECGVAGTTARKVADMAGVSPGLVIHHFGSMEGLRAACDEHVADAIRRAKAGAMASGPELDVFGLMRDTDIGFTGSYLARMLSDDSPAVENLVDDLIADAELYFEQGVESGMLRPSDDPRGRAVVLVLWSLGGLVLHRHFKRLLGADLTDPDLATNPSLMAYMAPAYEILGSGIFTEALASRLRSAATEAKETGPERAPSTQSAQKETR